MFLVVNAQIEPGIARPSFRARPLVTGTGGYPRDPPGAAPKARSLTDVSSPGEAGRRNDFAQGAAPGRGPGGTPRYRSLADAP